MTRQEFIDNIDNFDELIEFCNDERCDACEDIYYEDSYDEYINESLCDWAREYDWREMLNILDSLPSGYSYYRSGDEWEGLTDDDFNDYKDEVLEWADNNDVWDEPDEEEEELVVEDDWMDELDEEDDDYVEPEDGCSLQELFVASSQVINRVATDEADDDEAAAMIQMLMYA